MTNVEIDGVLYVWLAREFSSATDKSSEVGKIVFKITVDSEGQILSIRVQSTTLTQATTNIYKEDIKYGAVFRPRYLKGTTIATTSSGLLTVHVKVRGNTQFIL